MGQTIVGRFTVSLARDTRYALRDLHAHPAFSLAALALLTLGIGGATLVFSVVNAVLLRDLPVRAPGRLARIVQLEHNRGAVSEYPYPVFEEWRRRSSTFAATFAQTDLDASCTEGNESFPARVQIVTSGYYSVLGVEPFLGRLLTPEDAWATRDELPVVLSYHFWQSRFHASPQALGRLLHLAGHPFTIVGITRPGFNGISVDSGPDMQVPFIAGQYLIYFGSQAHDPRRCCLWEIAGRLRPAIALPQAQAETSAAMKAAFTAAFAARRPLSAGDRRWIENFRFRVEPLSHGVSWLRQKFSTGLAALLCAALLLALLASVNVAGLVLARVAAGERQNAIRLAVGASRLRLMQHWFIEVALLSLAGSGAALLVTAAVLPSLSRFLPPIRNMLTEQLPIALYTSLDFRVFAFCALLCCGLAIAAAFSPAWHATGTDLMTPLKSAAAGPRSARARLVLLTAQIAICTLVIANAGLLWRTLRNLELSNPGFRTSHAITFTVDTALQNYQPAQAFALAQRLSREARTLPGVADASVALKPLLRGSGMKTTIVPLNGNRSAVEELNADSNIVMPRYFETLGMRLIAGRAFNDQDMRPGIMPSPRVVNESFVKRFFPNVNPIGRFCDYPENPLVPRFEIIGVIADSKYRSLREPPQPAVFELLNQPDQFLSEPYFQLVVRSFVEPVSIVSSVRGLLHRIDPRLPFREVHTLREDVDASLWPEHTLVLLGLFFSLVSALLSAVGLHSVLACTVVERSREIGIRLALGARPPHVLRAAAMPVLVSLIVGIAAGLAASVASATLVRSLLFRVSPWNPVVLFLAGFTVLAIACSAALLPALRALHLDPAATLRHA